MRQGVAGDDGDDNDDDDDGGPDAGRLASAGCDPV
jgi:hypothetical protein